MAARIARKKPVPKPAPEIVEETPQEITPPSTWRRLLPAMLFVAVLVAMVIGFYSPDRNVAVKTERKSEKVRVEAQAQQKHKANYDEAKALFAAWQASPYAEARDQWLQLSHRFYDIYEDAKHWPNRPAALMRAAEVMQHMAKGENSKADYKIAINLYEKVVREFPESVLADDALYAMADIWANPLDDSAKSLALLEKLRTNYAQGDMFARAMRLEKALQAAAKKVSAQTKDGASSAKKEQPKKEQSKKDQQEKQGTQSPAQAKAEKTVEKNKPTPSQIANTDPPKPAFPRPKVATLVQLATKYALKPPTLPSVFHIYQANALSGGMWPLPVLAEEKLLAEAPWDFPEQEEKTHTPSIKEAVAESTGNASATTGGKTAPEKADAQEKGVAQSDAPKTSKGNASTATAAKDAAEEPKKLLLAEEKALPTAPGNTPKALPLLAATPPVEAASKVVPAPKPKAGDVQTLPSVVIMSPPPVAPVPTKETQAKEKNLANDVVVASILGEKTEVALQPLGKQENRRRMSFIPDLVPDLKPVALLPNTVKEEKKHISAQKNAPEAMVTASTTATSHKEHAEESVASQSKQHAAKEADSQKAASPQKIAAEKMLASSIVAAHTPTKVHPTVKQAEAKRMAEVKEREAKLLAEVKQVEAKRMAEAKAREAKLLAEAKARETKLLAEAKQAEAKRIAAAKQAGIAEGKRIAEAKQAEAQRKAEAKQAAEAKRIAEAQRKAEAKQAAEAKRIAEAQRQAEAKQAAEAKRIAEAQRQAEAKHAAAAKGNPTPDLSSEELAARVQQAKKDDLAAQLGLSVRTVFVDIGHGGRDPGTMHNGLVERDVVLDIGKRVGALLQRHGIKVIYSRTTDVTVALSSRPISANEVGADLFVSIHMNAFSDVRIQGFETYYLDFSRNSEASRVATLENSVSDKSLGDLQDVLAKMLLNVRTQESAGLAKAIQKSTMQAIRQKGFITKNGGTRSAPFHVLIGTAMPAVLVEVGYCTNKLEAKRLKRDDYRTILAQGIVQGILAYKGALQQKMAALLP